MANFRVPFLQNGALLVSGTTDSSFVATIPSGVEHKAIYYVGEMDDEHVSSMMETDLVSPLKELQTFDPICYSKAIAASGKIPRELKLLAEHLEPISTRAKRARESPESISQTDNKKLKKDFEDCIAEHIEIRKGYHRDYLEAVIKQDQKDGVDVFESLLFDWCKEYFIDGRQFAVYTEVLRVPNFTVSPQGGSMRPTMPCASAVYFEWFLRKCEDRNLLKNNRATQLNILASNSIGSERGHSLEKLLSTCLTLLGARGLMLRCRLLGDPEQTIHSFFLEVKDRVFTSASNPPKSYFDFADGTLLSHMDQAGGEARVDFIYYSKKHVVFFEATVGNYRSTKLPPEDDSTEKREEKILASINKWIGAEFVVELKKAGTPPELSAGYRAQYHSRSNAQRPDPPDVSYIIATTCPSSVQPQASRIPCISWIKVCFLDDLVDSGLIPAEKKDDILKVQAQDAG